MSQKTELRKKVGQTWWPNRPWMRLASFGFRQQIMQSDVIIEFIGVIGAIGAIGIVNSISPPC